MDFALVAYSGAVYSHLKGVVGACCVRFGWYFDDYIISEDVDGVPWVMGD